MDYETISDMFEQTKSYGSHLMVATQKEKDLEIDLGVLAKHISENLKFLHKIISSLEKAIDEVDDENIRKIGKVKLDTCEFMFSYLKQYFNYIIVLYR